MVSAVRIRLSNGPTATSKAFRCHQHVTVPWPATLTIPFKQLLKRKKHLLVEFWSPQCPEFLGFWSPVTSQKFPSHLVDPAGNDAAIQEFHLTRLRHSCANMNKAGNKHWLVVDLPLWKILVSWNDYSQYMEKNKNVPNHQPEKNARLLSWVAGWSVCVCEPSVKM